ncbi:MAG: hypothetical protein FWE94_05895 [Coriobacteriia bacterium]|nr:hypothetical protein [Coriobacteriia bacterium]
MRGSADTNNKPSSDKPSVAPAGSVAPATTPASDTPDIPARRPVIPAETIEAEARSRHRQKLVRVAIVLAMVALVGVGAFGFLRFSKRMEAAKNVGRATVMIQEADKAVVEIDKTIRADVTPELAEEATAKIDVANETTEKLADAVALIDSARPSLNKREQERAGLLKVSAERRIEMLGYVPEILTVNAQAARALAPASEGWESLLEAEKVSEQAVAAYNKLTKDQVTLARTLNEKAGSILATANEHFLAAEEAFSEAPFERYLEYVEARIELNALSLQSDDAWLANDIAKANELADQYNAADKHAVSLAEELPKTPHRAILSAFEEMIEEQMEKYYEARDRTLEADEALRKY